MKAPDPQYVFRANPFAISSVCFSLDGSRMFYGDSMGEVKQVFLDTKRGIALADQSSENHDQKKDDYNQKVNDYNQSIEKEKKKAHKEGVMQIEVLPGDRLLTQGRENVVHLWQLSPPDPSGASPQPPVLQKSYPADSLTFCRFSALVLSLDDTLEREVSEGFGGSTEFMAVLFSNEENPLHVIDLTKGQVLNRKFQLPSDAQRLGSCMAMKLFVHLTSRKMILCAGFEGGSVAFWDVHSGAFLSSLRIHQEPVLCLDVCPDRNLLVTGGAERKLGAADLTDLTKVQEVDSQIQLKTTGLSDIKFRPDGKILATAGWDSKIRIFQAKNFKPLAILEFHREGVQCLAFSPLRDSNLMAAGSKDTRVSLWGLY